MPPKKVRSKRRESNDEEEEELKTDTELLSPSEVVKIRKKTDMADTKEGKMLPRKAKVTRSSKEAQEKVARRRDPEKRSRDGRQKKVDNETKRAKILQEKRKSLKKSKSEEENADSESVIYPCGICTKEVSDTDDAILCEAGCEFWYHRHCTGMTDIAYQFLTNQDNAEWVCDKCIATKSVPLVKIKSYETVS